MISAESSIIYATELRHIQQTKCEIIKKFHQEEKNNKTTRFRNACEEYSELLIAEAKTCIEKAKSTSHTYAILDETKITQRVGAFSYSTLLYGLWNSTTKKFDDSIFVENNILHRPFERAASYLKQFGYKLENISDASRSFRLVIKLSWEKGH